MIETEMKLSIDQMIRVTDGQILQQGKREFDSFGIDSRKMKDGGLFFALRGTVSDGHLHVRDAIRNGAAGAIVERGVDAESDAITLIQVQDSLLALQDLAGWVRTKSSTKVIGITGSSGKTSTKEFTAVLLAERFSVFKSEGNLNSITGLPLALLAMNQEDCAVIEAGMNKPGEMASLSAIMKPDIAILLNVNPVHLEGLHGLEQIADEKVALTHGMSPDALVIYNADDRLLSERVGGIKQKTMSFGFSPDASLRIADFVSEGVHGSQATFVWNQGSLTFKTKLCGMGNMMNLAASATAAISLQVTRPEMLRGFQKLEPYQQRGILLELGGVHIYDDSYNSNPRALELALQIMGESKRYRRKVAILGDMLELGPGEVKFHKKLGEQVASHGMNVLITAGPLSKYMAEAAQRSGVLEVFATENSEEAASIARKIVKAGDLVLVKGSRGIKMETVIEALRNR
jgi:UDP-N-acetylmuramoyl-tripeptide--D-alanyl-D-alanine ligase